MLVAPVPQTILEEEIEGLPPDRLLYESEDEQVFVARSGPFKGVYVIASSPEFGFQLWQVDPLWIPLAPAPQ